MSCDNYNIACDEILDLGCADHCGNVEFDDIIIPTAGNYIIEYVYLNVKRYHEVVVENNNDPLVLNMFKFPANQEILFKIMDADTLDLVSIDAYSYFKIRTQIKIIN